MSALPQPLPPGDNFSESSSTENDHLFAPLPLAIAPSAPPTPLIRRVVLPVVVAMNLVGGLLSFRRILEYVTTDLPLTWVLGVGLVATVIAKCSRIAWRQTYGIPVTQADQRNDTLVGYGTSVGLALLAVGTCYPGYRNSDWLIWLPMLIADQFWRQNFFAYAIPELAVISSTQDATEEAYESKDPASVDHAGGELANEHLLAARTTGPITSTPPEAGQLLQQLFRVRDAEGYEVIYGTVRADFAAGQRHASVHVGFCPPLSALPSVEAEANNFAEARVQVVQALAHGVRLDIRLSEAAEEACSVDIDLAASPAAT